jgi:hypothetical protein
MRDNKWNGKVKQKNDEVRGKGRNRKSITGINDM